ncbi:HET-like protein [Apiospora arundinis]|uniref:HET-like protein n=1 Tax=Apiospora arundinis TaxID=335852 RepID=A0ABR2HSV4_9PEZI
MRLIHATTLELREFMPPEVPPYTILSHTWGDEEVSFQDMASPGRITRVPIDTLRGDKALSESSVGARLSWAAKRETTRAEDEAYCLLGIFQLNMALLYGEGHGAFQRLQHEIMARYSDLTIFAWDLLPGHNEGLVGILAPSPAAFENSSGVMPFSNDLAEFSVTNKGLLLTGGIPLRVALTEWRGLEATLYLLVLGLDHSQKLGIYLRKIGPKLFCRVGRISLAGIGRHKCRQTAIYSVNETRLLMDSTPVHTRTWQRFRQNALYVPANPEFKLQQAIPGTLWDRADSVFLKPEQYSWVKYSMVLAMIFQGNLSITPTTLVVLCDYRREPPDFKIFAWDEYPREAALIFQEKYREDTMSWEDLGIIAPAVLATGNSLGIQTQSGLQHVSVSYARKFVWSEEAPVGSVFAIN